MGVRVHGGWPYIQSLMKTADLQKFVLRDKESLHVWTLNESCTVQEPGLARPSFWLFHPPSGSAQADGKWAELADDGHNK